MQVCSDKGGRLVPSAELINAKYLTLEWKKSLTVGPYYTPSKVSPATTRGEMLSHNRRAFHDAITLGKISKWSVRLGHPFTSVNTEKRLNVARSSPKPDPFEDLPLCGYGDLASNSAPRPTSTGADCPSPSRVKPNRILYRCWLTPVTGVLTMSYICKYMPCWCLQPATVKEAEGWYCVKGTCLADIISTWA